jgi:hypothetical protein
MKIIEDAPGSWQGSTGSFDPVATRECRHIVHESNAAPDADDTGPARISKEHAPALTDR